MARESSDESAIPQKDSSCRTAASFDGDGEAMMPPASFELHRFTRQEVREGLAEGWRLHAGWFRRASGLEWAWFTRDVATDAPTGAEEQDHG